MRIIRSIKKMAEFSRRARRRGLKIGFVPTMGALHEGHLSLIRKAGQENDLVVVSIFVNPAQFSPTEDFRSYPRKLAADARLCNKEKVDIIFYPRPEEMYPQAYRTYVCVEALSQLLCGRFRPGHFKGVATVVNKLLNIVAADISYFGQKDAQQAIIIKRMVEDLNMPVQVKVLPTLRQKDGLALSSRNNYLNKKQRKAALVLSAALALARDLIQDGERNTAGIIRRMKGVIGKNKGARIEYVSIVDSQDLRDIKRISSNGLISLAVWIGKTRLIDNAVIDLRKKAKVFF